MKSFPWLMSCSLLILSLTAHAFQRSNILTTSDEENRDKSVTLHNPQIILDEMLTYPLALSSDPSEICLQRGFKAVLPDSIGVSASQKISFSLKVGNKSNDLFQSSTVSEISCVVDDYKTTITYQDKDESILERTVFNGPRLQYGNKSFPLKKSAKLICKALGFEQADEAMTELSEMKTYAAVLKTDPKFLNQEFGLTIRKVACY